MRVNVSTTMWRYVVLAAVVTAPHPPDRAAGTAHWLDHRGTAPLVMAGGEAPMRRMGDLHGAVRVAAPPASTASLLGAVDFVDARHGWAAGQGIMATVDGGQHWQQQVASAGMISDQITFVTTADGWALGQARTDRRLLLRTTDGGRHWTTAGLPAVGNLQATDFLSPLHGFGITAPPGPGSSGLVQTVDGGRTWRALRTPLPVTAVCFATARTGWVLAPAEHRVLRTTDSGRTWHPSLDMTPITRGQLGCAGPATVWALLVSGVSMSQESYGLFRSDDGGRGWRAVVGQSTAGGGPAPGNATRAPRGPWGYGARLAVVNASTAFVVGGCPVCGDLGLLQVGGTSTGGRTWHTSPPLPGIGYSFSLGLSFITPARGWMAVSPPIDRTYTPAGRVLATADGGHSWQQVYPPVSSPLPCRVADLSAVAGWQGATGALAGRLDLYNVGTARCALPGTVRVQVVDAAGRILPVTAITLPAAAPAGAVTVPPAWQASLALLWHNWCGARPRTLLALRVAFARAPRQFLTVPVTDPTGLPVASIPRCDAPRASSTLGVGTLSATDPTAPTSYVDNTGSPVALLMSYYNAVNRRDYARAFDYLAAEGRPAYAPFVAGYTDTAAVRIIRLQPARTLQASNFHALTCVAIVLVSTSSRGFETTYGGWYQVTSTTGQLPHVGGWRIVLRGTHVSAGGSASLPARAPCGQAHR